MQIPEFGFVLFSFLILFSGFVIFVVNVSTFRCTWNSDVQIIIIIILHIWMLCIVVACI